MKNYFIGASVAGVNPSIPYRSFLQLYNPSNSGVFVSISAANLSWDGGASAPVRSGFDIRTTDIERGTFQKNCHNKTLGQLASKAQIRFGICDAIYLPADTGIIYEPWVGIPLDDHSYEFAPEIILPPGFGIAVCSAHDNTACIASFQFSETPVSE